MSWHFTDHEVLNRIAAALDRIADTLDRIAAQTAPAMPPAPPAGASSATAAVSEPVSSGPARVPEPSGWFRVECHGCGLVATTEEPLRWAVSHHDHAHRPRGEPFHFTTEPTTEPLLADPDAWAGGFAANH